MGRVRIVYGGERCPPLPPRGPNERLKVRPPSWTAAINDWNPLFPVWREEKVKAEEWVRTRIRKEAWCMAIRVMEDRGGSLATPTVDPHLHQTPDPSSRKTRAGQIVRSTKKTIAAGESGKTEGKSAEERRAAAAAATFEKHWSGGCLPATTLLMSPPRKWAGNSKQV